jgi:hypothetical protein
MMLCLPWSDFFSYFQSQNGFGQAKFVHMFMLHVCVSSCLLFLRSLGKISPEELTLTPGLNSPVFLLTMHYFSLWTLLYYICMFVHNLFLSPLGLKFQNSKDFTFSLNFIVLIHKTASGMEKVAIV